MTTYSTGNQIGSKDPRDLYDNAENLDTAVNDTSRDTWADRLGRSRKTMSGMEREFDADQASRDNRFNTFIASSGYQFLGDYAAGIEITEYNQIVRDADGEFWRVSGQVDLPYTTTGAGLPEGDALTPLGDAVLRQQLDDINQGAALLGRGVLAVDSIADLLALTEGQRKEGLRYLVKGYHTGSDTGGGEFYWDRTRSSENDGGIVIQGFIRKLSGPITPQMFGAVGDGETDDRQAIQAAFDYLRDNAGGDMHFPAVPEHYSIKTTHPDHPQHGLVLHGNSAGAGSRKLSGTGPSSAIRLDTPSTVTSLMYWPEAIRYLTIIGMWLDANNKADYVLKADEVHSPLLTIEDTDFRNALDKCVSLSTFLTSLTRCNTFNGLTGFNIVGIGSGPVTSITMNSCYALQARDVGFNFGYATYCVLNACAVDGKRATNSMHTRYAYKFASAYGVTMNSCGSEQTQRFLKVDVYRGFVLNAPFMLSAGGVDAPVDYLVEFVSGRNATVSGIQIEGGAAAGFNYVLASTGSGLGSENITVTDSCVNRDQVYSVSTYSFNRPVKLLRGDQTERDRTVDIANTAELRDFMRTWLSQYEINHQLTLQLEDGVYDLSQFYSDPMLLSGRGGLTIQGNPTNRSAVSIVTGTDSFSLIGVTCAFTMRDLTISSAAAMTTAPRVLLTDCSKVYFDNVSVTRGGFNTGYGIRLTRSTLTLLRGSEVSGGFLIGGFDIDAASRVRIRDDAPPTSGTWTSGMVVEVASPSAGGYREYVCVTSGAPGVWKGAGAVEG